MLSPIGLRRALAATFVACAVTVATLATEPAPRVYTNADLRRLEPIPSQEAPLAAFDAEAWARVSRWLETEHARLDADLERRHEAELAARVEPTPRPAALRTFGGFFPFRPVHPRPIHRRVAPPNRPPRRETGPDAAAHPRPVVRERRAPPKRMPRPPRRD